MSLSLELKGAKPSLLGSISVKFSAFPATPFPRPSLQKMHHFTGPWCVASFWAGSVYCCSRVFFTATGLCTLAQLVPANQRRGSNSGWPIKIVVSSIRGDLSVQYVHKHNKWYEPSHTLHALFCILEVSKYFFINGPCVHQYVYCTLKLYINTNVEVWNLLFNFFLLVDSKSFVLHLPTTEYHLRSGCSIQLEWRWTIAK